MTETVPDELEADAASEILIGDEWGKVKVTGEDLARDRRGLDLKLDREILIIFNNTTVQLTHIVTVLHVALILNFVSSFQLNVALL